MLRLAGRSLVLVIAAIALLLLGLIADAERRRDGYFVERRGTQVSEVEDPSGGLNNDGFTLVNNTGLSVRVRVLLPAKHDVPLRTLVVLGGYGTGASAVELVDDFDDIAVVALDYPYDGSLRFDGGWEILRALPAVRRALLDTPPSISLTVSWLQRQPWVDLQRLELVGVSFGVPFAGTAAALDSRISRLWLVHGAADNYLWLKANVDRWAERPWSQALLARALYWVAYAPSFNTTERVKAIAPRPVTIVGARQDERTPKGETEALFAAAAEPKQLLWTEGLHVEPRREDVIRALLALVVHH